MVTVIDANQSEWVPAKWTPEAVAAKWTQQLTDVIASKKLGPGDAGKIRGAFGWALGNLFSLSARGHLVELDFHPDFKTHSNIKMQHYHHLILTF